MVDTKTLAAATSANRDESLFLLEDHNPSYREGGIIVRGFKGFLVTMAPLISAQNTLYTGRSGSGQAFLHFMRKDFLSRVIPCWSYAFTDYNFFVCYYFPLNDHSGAL